MNTDLIFGMEPDLAWVLLASLIAIVIGGVLFFIARRKYKLAKKTSNWPRTTGTVVKSGIVSSWSGTGRNVREVYYPDIHYKYNVDKQKYSSSQIFVGSIGRSGSYSYAEKYVSKYPVGKQVMVYYSPNIYQLSNKEKYAVLEKGVNYTLYGSGFLGVLTIGAGSAGAFFILQQAYTYGVLMAVGSIVAGIWLGHKFSGSELVDMRKKYNVSRDQVFGKIPGTDGFAGGKSNQLMDIFVKAGDSVLSKRKWRVRVK